MTRWPWITPVGVAAIAISPLGQEVIHGLGSSESITRDLSGFLLMCGLAIAAGLLAAEWIIRNMIAKRRQRDVGDGRA